VCLLNLYGVLKIAQLKILKAISAKSKLTEKEALELGRKINKSLHQRLSS
jgi:hypothetical protein